MSDKPSFIRALPELTDERLEILRKQYRCGLASLLAVDRGVKRLVTAVEKAGETNRTVFVFTSDHGYFFGEHRLGDTKYFAYAEGLQVPLVVKLPKRYRPGADRVPRVGQQVANIDLAPTIVQLAGAEPCRRAGKCRTMDGRSLLPLLRNPTPSWPAERAFAIEIALPASASPPICSYQGIRTPSDFYIQHESVENPATGLCEPASEVEHYDRAADPFELENIFPAAPGSTVAVVEQQLATELTALRSCSGIEGRDRGRKNRAFCQ